jgi:hypothetical protein
MQIKIKLLFKILIIIVFLFLFKFSVQCSWFEYESPELGNLPSLVGFNEIPNSPYIVMSNRGYEGMALLDKKTLKIKGSFKTNYYKSNPFIFQNSNSGWDLYYTNEAGFFRLHIKEEGVFGDNISLSDKDLSNSIFFEIPDKKEAWFVSDKIILFNGKDESFTEFSYPVSWDPINTLLKIFPTDNSDKMIITSKGTTFGFYQAVIADLLSHEIKKIDLDDMNIFDMSYDIKEWKGHEDSYIILKKDSVNCFNLKTGSVSFIIDGFETYTKKIFQKDDGSQLYFFHLFSPDLYVLDLNEKKFDLHTISMDPNCEFITSYNEYEPDKNRIITGITEDILNGADIKLVILNPESLEIKNITDKLYPYDVSINPFKKEEKLFIRSVSPDYIDLVNIDTGEITSSLNLSSNPIGWSVMKGSNGPDILSNSISSFCRLQPISRREFINSDITPTLVCQFPDGGSALIADQIYSWPLEMNYMIYNFNDKSSKEIALPFSVTSLIPDPNENQIIGFNLESKRWSTKVLFIKPSGDATSWQVPSEFDTTSSIKYFDVENNTLWLILADTIGDYHFYKLSTETKTLTDSFLIAHSDLNFIRSTTSLAPDPLGRYFYIVNETSGDNVKRELLFYDLSKKEIIKRVDLQTNVINNEDTFKFMVIPGVIPIPEKDKLFLWDGYGSWCFDMSNMEKIYGTVIDNPQIYAPGGDYSYNIESIYNDKRDLVVVVDHSWDKTKSHDEYKSIYEINLETGQVINRIGFHPYIDHVFFPKNKDEIYFLFQDEARIEHLLLNPGWNTPASIAPSTNYIQLGEGDNAKFTINVKNPYDFEQNVTAYIWMYTPDGTALFFTPTGLSFNVAGIPLTLPANLDITGDILTFTVPTGLPEGFWNFNAVFINDNGDRGPIGTWNFYVKD